MIILFGLPGLLLLFVVAIIAAASTRVCPHCAERIKKAATACRYCGRDVGQLRPVTELPPLDPNAPKPSRVPQVALAVVLLAGIVAIVLYSQTDAPAPPTKERRLQVAAPPMLPPAAPFVDAPIATASSPKALPKDAKPKAPAGPLRIAPQ